MPVNVSKALEISMKTAKSLLAVSYKGPIAKPKVFASYKAQATGALLAFDEEMTVHSGGWQQVEKTRAETLSKQSKLQLILASIDSSVLHLWPNDIAECQTADDLLRFLTKKLGDKTPTWEKKEKYLADLKAVCRRPGERYVDFYDRLNTAAGRVYDTDQAYRKSYVAMEFYLQLGQPAKQYVRIHKDGNQEDPATFAVTLDDKGLYSDKDDQPATVANLSAVNQEQQNVPDQRSDDIAALQAQITQVLKILSEQQVNQQVQGNPLGSGPPRPGPPRPGPPRPGRQDISCWACGKQGHIARSCPSVPPCRACHRHHRERRLTCEQKLSQQGNGKAQ